MVIQLVCYKLGTRRDKKLELNTKLFNESKADILLFPGWSFIDPSQVIEFKRNIKNKNTFAVFELKELGTRKLTNCLLTVDNGKLNFSSFQIFSTSGEINSNPILADFLIEKLDQMTKFTVQGRVIRILQCGELNILRNEQANDNKAFFRFDDNKQLAARFNEIVKGSDIFLNPLHTPMGNQGKMVARRRYLSQNGRSYFSVANAPNSSDFKGASLQYAFHNGKPLSAKKIEEGSRFALFEYSILPT